MSPVTQCSNDRRIALVAVAALALGACAAVPLAETAGDFNPPPGQAPKVFDADASEITADCAYGDDGRCDLFAHTVRDLLLSSLNYRLATMPKTAVPARVRIHFVEQGQMNAVCTVGAIYPCIGLAIPFVPTTITMEAVADVQVGSIVLQGKGVGECQGPYFSTTKASECAAGKSAIAAINAALASLPQGATFATARGGW